MQFDQKRRAFITLLGAAAAWPIAARAQQRERVRRVGVITNALADDPAAQSRLTAFVQGLQQLGWSDSRNVRIDTRWGAGDTERVRRYAAELVALAPDVILTVGSPTTGPLLQVGAQAAQHEGGERGTYSRQVADEKTESDFLAYLARRSVDCMIR